MFVRLLRVGTGPGMSDGVEAERFARDATGLHARLVRVVAAVCGDVSLAEECAQEALVRAWERVDDGAGLRSLEAWTVRVALNWCRTQQRRRGAEDRALVRLGSLSEGTPDPAPMDDGVMAAIAGLPPRQREVVVLHYLLDMGVDDIAVSVGTSSGAVKNALFHGRAALAERLAPPQDQEEPA